MPDKSSKTGARSAMVDQVIRFVMVGGFATLVHYVILVALVELTGLDPVIATSIGYMVGVITSFLLNRKYTFKNQSSAGRSFVKYCLVYLVGMGLNAALMKAFMGQGAPYLLAQVIATGIVLVWSFLGSRFLVFRSG